MKEIGLGNYILIGFVDDVVDVRDDGYGFFSCGFLIAIVLLLS